MIPGLPLEDSDLLEQYKTFTIFVGNLLHWKSVLG
jgi:hypothetical protein